MRPSRFLILLALPLFSFATGCAGTHSSASNTNSSPLYVVTAESTAFYSHGPRQGGPDQQIPRDTLLRLVRYSPSFSKVSLLEGHTGYVLTDDIAPSRQPVPFPTQPTLGAASQSAPAVASAPITVPEAPLPEVEPAPLPGQTDTH